MERRNTRQRQLVLDAVRELDDHPTADEVYLRVREKDGHVSRGTVYRNLHILVESGDIISVKAFGGERFDRRSDCHAHLVCTECGSVTDVPAPDVSAGEHEVERTWGFTDVRASTIFYGICPSCQKKSQAAE
ncbi:transcriptional repressor [Olsenella umbonata]|uniref:Transcriptional repressor n=1 Tax=Parafannyhessea umbonata TaxID=604330 RepID=A0A7X9Y0Q0_9ACTN|nr:Fur family transcriptional regulator [Parafannyhessea umbonata]NMF26338.1 transcriptional repressor [Parafannyhessea umbonata]